MESESAILNFLMEKSSPEKYVSIACEILNSCNDIDCNLVDVCKDISESTSINIESTGKNVRNFFETLDQCSENEYQEHFRMNRSTMDKLMKYLRQKVLAERIYNMIVPFEKKVHVTVWTLANKESYREIGNLFGLHKSTVSHTFHEIASLISDCRFDLIKWPTQQEQETTRNYVFEENGFPNCVGFVDGCHIQILGPAKNPVDFFNRKEVHSVVLQGICNETLRFLNIYVGQTGRAHDARVFRESNISGELGHLVVGENHILGDSAYTLSSRLLTPYRDNGHLTDAQKKYNKAHAGARAYIERCFGRLKGKFRRLKYLEFHLTENISEVISACCVLHNFILIYEPVPNNFNEEHREPHINLDGLSGIEKRNTICDFLT